MQRILHISPPSGGMVTSGMSDNGAIRVLRNDPRRSEYSTGERISGITIGSEHIFWRKGLHLYALPLNTIVRFWRRLEEVSSKTGCCSNDFSVHTLVVLDRGGEVHEMKIGEGLYRHEPERLLERLSQKLPEAVIGKP